SSHESIPWLQRLLPAERMHAAHDSRAGIVGGAGVLPFTMTVPGARVATAGVTVVGVLPTHRRRGILTAMMRKQLDDVHERGEPLAALLASEGSIYGRFGYGLASLSGSVDVRREHGRFAAESAGDARMIDTAEALEVLPPLYDSIAAATPGMVSRSPDWWELRTLDDSEWRRGGAGGLTRVLLELDGEPAAYALYRLKMAWEHGSSTGSVNVVEAVGKTPAATRAIWRFLLDIDWMQSVNASLLPVDHPLLLFVPEPRRLRFRVQDALWARLVDVGAALSARTYAGEGSVVLAVTDAFCPWNDGVWRVEAREAERSFDEPELALDVAALGSVYLGGFGFTQLARAGRVEERAPGALERADALFASEPAPWCPEIF
nr:GNAT family N-acetyltransferase [Actinomycetota bacterium]